MFKIAIPTYKRYETFPKKTLKILIDHKIPLGIIYIFVATQEEYLKYTKTIPKEYHSRLFVTNAIGIMNVRNYIVDFFSQDEFIFCLDDDLKEIYVKTPCAPEQSGGARVKNGETLKRLEYLMEFISLAFELCLSRGSRLFSVYPVQNAYFMRDEIHLGLTYCMGGCMGFINDKSLKVSVNDKEDYERSIQYFKKYGSVIRFNNVCCGTKGYTGSGGIQSFDRSYEVILEACNSLLVKYPQEVQGLNLNKKSGKPEIYLKRITRDILCL